MFRRIVIATAVAATMLITHHSISNDSDGRANAQASSFVGKSCGFRGGRGYDSPSGNECRAQYNIRAESFPNGRLTFHSDGRTWWFQCYQEDGECELIHTIPETRTEASGHIGLDANGDINGWYDSEFCGRGWISLTLEGCD